MEKGEEDISPDPTSQTLADGWRAGVAKVLERRINAVALEGAQIDLARTFLTRLEMNRCSGDHVQRSKAASTKAMFKLGKVISQKRDYENKSDYFHG